MRLFAAILLFLGTFALAAPPQSTLPVKRGVCPTTGKSDCECGCLSGGACTCAAAFPLQVIVYTGLYHTVDVFKDVKQAEKYFYSLPEGKRIWQSVRRYSDSTKAKSVKKKVKRLRQVVLPVFRGGSC